MIARIIWDRRELDAQGCKNPKCKGEHGPLCLIAQCHPEAGMSVKYERETGLLCCYCKECDLPVSSFIIGEKH